MIRFLHQMETARKKSEPQMGFETTTRSQMVVGSYPMYLGLGFFFVFPFDAKNVSRSTHNSRTNNVH